MVGEEESGGRFSGRRGGAVRNFRVTFFPDKPLMSERVLGYLLNFQLDNHSSRGFFTFSTYLFSLNINAQATFSPPP